MPRIRILALEDNTLHADILRMTLDTLGYDLIDIADNSKDLIRLLEATDPDLLLMDVDIGEAFTGIDLVKKINENIDIPVIYVTSLKEEQVFKKAKETLPDAYINKPYQPQQLQAAIELAFYKKQKESSYIARSKSKDISAKSVFVKEGDNLIKISLPDILLVEAYDKYCFIYTREKKYLLSIQLKNIADSLPPEQFLQVHRSYIINIDAIEKVRLSQNSLEIAGKQVPFSKTYKNTLFSRLKML
jgi:DNA-binding LytR/AlgR family response regulator